MEADHGPECALCHDYVSHHGCHEKEAATTKALALAALRTQSPILVVALIMKDTDRTKDVENRWSKLLGENNPED